MYFSGSMSVRSPVWDFFYQRRRQNQMRVQYLQASFIVSRWKYNKPGTAQVGAISKAQKDSKTKPLFLQLETTKALKKLKIEKKNSEFFLKFF